MQIIDSESDLNVHRKPEALESTVTGGACGDGGGVTTVGALRLLGVNINDYAASVAIFALK